ncbi:MAG: anhydro-N-acetylmuramic acid kinase [Acidobacteriota bacterium]
MNRFDRLLAVTRKQKRRVIGIMTGTSVDGIDAALTEITGHGASASIEMIAFRTYPFPPDIRKRVFRLFDPATARINEICTLDFLLGELFAAAVIHLLRELNMDPVQIDVVGSAGQTIWHDPQPFTVDRLAEWIDAPVQTRATLAIGQSAVIAERTGILTVGDLRVRDVAAGGHGAPLVAYADWVLLRSETLGRCVQNIGGISNVTYVPPAAQLADVIAFDTGPGNMVIDALTEVASGGRSRFDREGRIAAGGKVVEPVLENWLHDPFFRKEPPKTTGREQFGVQFARRAMTESPDIPIEDLIATATALTSRSIADAYRQFIEPRGPIDEVIIGGGGALNVTMMRQLGKLLPDVKLLRHEDFGIDSKAKEALAIAIIANDAVSGIDTNVAGATGAHPAVLGKISL